jgi:hypothetical protein
MNLSGVTSRGPELDAKNPLLVEVPAGYANLLRQINGFVTFEGGFHLRGICDAPAWHSLHEAWRGSQALHRLFLAVRASDVPFGQDCLGDQFLLREGVVHKLSAEAGEVSSMELSLGEFLERMAADPFDFLQLQPLAQFHHEGGRLEPGQLLSVYPPFITKESADGVSIRAIPVDDRIAFLADVAREVASVLDGEQIRFVITE